MNEAATRGGTISRSSRSRARALAPAVLVATSWMRYVTRKVDPRLAEDREAEFTFELWEFGIAADNDDWSGIRAGCSLTIRVMLGVRRDLAWRRAALRTGLSIAAPIRLLSRRRRPRAWVPLQSGHLFDQTNGVIERRRATPPDRCDDPCVAGSGFGARDGGAPSSQPRMPRGE